MAQHTQTEPILRVEELQKVYGRGDSRTVALDGLSFAVERGDFLGIMGASGSGKTTLLNLIAAIDAVSGGTIYLEGAPIHSLKPRETARFRREHLGFIFQDFNLLDTLTIYENIALALTIAGVPARAVPERIAPVAQALNIEPILRKFPWQVSGGEKQRAAAARAIVTDPGLVLADEPTGALDSKSSAMLLDAITALNHDLGATVLMVTHDAFAASYCSRILFIRDGKLFSELTRGADSRTEFFERILQVVAQLGGDDGHVC